MIIIAGYTEQMSTGATLTIESNRLVTNDEFVNYKLQEGWSREPVTRMLNIPEHLIETAFPPYEQALSCVAIINQDEIIGHVNMSDYKLYEQETSYRFEALYAHENYSVSMWGALLKKIAENEKHHLMPYLASENIFPEFIVHRRGIMVMPQYSFASQPKLKVCNALIEASDKLAASLEYKAIIVNCSNRKSKNAFLRNGYTEIAACRVSLQEYCVGRANADDYFFTLVKIL